MRLVIAVVAVLVASGCATVSTDRMTVREDALSVAGSPLRQAIVVGEVSSASEGIPKQKAEAALRQSLKGQGLLAKGPRNGTYSLRAEYELVEEPSWGMDQKATVRCRYRLASREGNGKLPDIVVETSFTSSMSPAAMYLGINEAVWFGSAAADSSERADKDQKKELSDAELGYPREGTPVSSQNANVRLRYAIEGAVRKNIARLIKTLKKEFGEAGLVRPSASR